jgi:Cu/Ag efflux pump CusA
MSGVVGGCFIVPWFTRNGGHNAQGREIEGPMALAILGGLITSVVRNLPVRPTLAFRFGCCIADSDEEPAQVG